jgi:hypothetical protein
MIEKLELGVAAHTVQSEATVFVAPENRPLACWTQYTAALIVGQPQFALAAHRALSQSEGTPLESSLTADGALFG